MIFLADPDKSNPTRNRWERPLDTIRSFEAAIDGGYRRKSVSRPDIDPVANWNRRSAFPGKPHTPVLAFTSAHSFQLSKWMDLPILGI